MFSLFIFRLKCLIRNKENMFWSYMFPLVLTTCFFFAFNNIWSEAEFETIKVAYVSDTSQDDYLRETMLQAEIADKTKMFEVIDTNLEEAAKKLRSGEIKAYIESDTIPVLHIKSNGLYETIAKAFIDQYIQTADTIQTLIVNNPEMSIQDIINDIMQPDSFINERQNNKKPDLMLIYFYSLLAFTILFAASWGLEEVISVQADQSECGARVNVSPVHKLKILACNMMAAFCTHALSIAILFLYMHYVLDVEFGSNLLYIVLICIVGLITGLALGAAVGVCGRQKREVKDVTLTAIIMIGSFLSGMMYAPMKYLIANKLPLLQYINPVNLITDALYSTYYYDTYERVILDIIILSFMAVVFIIASYLGLRRKSYASI